MSDNARSVAFAVWRNSIYRSVKVMRDLGSFVVEKGDPDRIMRQFHKSIADAARAEMSARVQTGEFAHLKMDEGVVEKREGYPWRAAEIGLALEARGYEKSVLPEDVVVYRREGEEIALDMDGEWYWKNRDETIAGDSLSELQGRINQEEN